VRVYSFFVSFSFFSFGWYAFGVGNFCEAFTSKTIEFWSDSCAGGRELTCERVGQWFLTRPTSSPNPSRPSPNPFGFFSAAPSPLPWTPPHPLSHLLLPQTLAATTTQNPSRPHPPLSEVQPSPLGSPSCGCELSIGVWREEEGRRKGRTQGGGLPDRT
jgi:hypothetical protein